MVFAKLKHSISEALHRPPSTANNGMIVKMALVNEAKRSTRYESYPQYKQTRSAIAKSVAADPSIQKYFQRDTQGVPGYHGQTGKAMQEVKKLIAQQLKGKSGQAITGNNPSQAIRTLLVSVVELAQKAA